MIIRAENLPHFSRRFRHLVFTTGCFDLIHVGHLEHLEFCRKLGDGLLVAVGNDRTVRQLKGAGRPVYTQEQRLRLLDALKCVDGVVLCEGDDPLAHRDIITLAIPQFYVVPENDPLTDEKRALAREMGTVFVACQRTPPQEAPEGISTSVTISQFGMTADEWFERLSLRGGPPQ